MDFESLEKLRRDLAELQESHVKTLQLYYLPKTGGFRHKFMESKDDFSKASTATCILSLTATGRWGATNDEEKKDRPWHRDTAKLVRLMLKKKNWESAGLPEGNPFTVAFLLEAVTALEELDASAGATGAVNARIASAVELLLKVLKDDAGEGVRGAAHIYEYPSSPYLTQLVVRVLNRRSQLTDPGLLKDVGKWAWSQVEHELALLFSGSKSGDPFALAYGIMIFVSCVQPAKVTPSQKQIVARAVDVIFQAQLLDGSWPRSQPLFHYPNLGNAYCFEYEMLTQLLQEKELEEFLLRHLAEFAKALERLKDTAFQLGEERLGWASGHHPQLPGPESWSTASVYHFCYCLDRLLAEAIRRSVFSHVGVEYFSPGKPKSDLTDFAIGFLDSDIQLGEEPRSLRDTLRDLFISPIAKHAILIERGQDLPRKVSISAIFFGPPGTSKTQMARKVSEFLNWPLLAIDPSHLVREGMDRIQAETNRLFGMLAELERVVVLLDEFDEMVRERTEERSEVLSRLLTTAMLPKLTKINDRRRIVFIVATNHIDHFDFAIRRPGRFDVLVQIMPPTVKSKLGHKDWKRIRKLLQEHHISTAGVVGTQLRDLTYAEFDGLRASLSNATNADAVKAIIQEVHSNCTLMQKVRDDTTWADLCDNQKKYNRVPGV